MAENIDSTQIIGITEISKLRGQMAGQTEIRADFSERNARLNGIMVLTTLEELLEIDPEGLSEEERKLRDIFIQRYSGAAALVRANYQGKEGVATFMESMVDPISYLVEKNKKENK